MSFAYYNGQFGDYNGIKIPLSDRSIFFGDGVYDACIGSGKRIYLENEHIERFISNAKKLSIPFSFSKEELSALLRETVKRSGISDFFLYFQAAAYSEERKHAPRDKERSNLLIIVKAYALPEKEKEMKLISYPDTRQSFCHIKTLNLLGSVLASESAACAGADEAVLVRGETVTECAHSNISIIRNGVLITHPLNEKILPGITRRHMILTAKKLGIEVRETPFSLSEIFSADDVLISSTSKLILRATELDGAKISVGNRRFGSAIIDDMFKCYRDFY